MANAVYDPETEEDKPSKQHGNHDDLGASEGLHDDLGMTDEQRRAQIDDLERSFSAPYVEETDEGGSVDASKIKSAESSATHVTEGLGLGSGLMDQLGKGYTSGPESKKKGFLGRLTARQKAASGGIVGAVLTFVFFIISIFSGPGAMVHFARVLHDFHFVSDQSLMNSRVGNLIRYRLSVDDPTSRNLGFFGNIIADRYVPKLNQAGMTTTYENRRIRYVDIDTNTPEGKAAYNNVLKQGVEAPIGADGKVRFDLSGTSARTRRHVISAMVESADISGVSSLVAKRLLKLRAAVSFHLMKNSVRAVDETILQYRDRLKKERKAYVEAGMDTTERTAKADGDKDKDGKVSQAEENGNRAASSASSEANDIVKKARAPNEPLVLKATGLKSSLARGVGVAGFVALTCGLQQLGDTIYDIRDANIVQPLIRKGMETQSVGSQIEAGQDTNLNEQGVYHADLYDEETQTSVFDAASIQGELGRPQTGPDLPDGQKPGFDRPVFLDILDATIGKIPGGAAVCGGVTSFVGGFILDGAGWALNSTGPVGFMLNASTSVIQGIITAQLIDSLIGWLSGQQVTADAAGALLGSQANYGVKLAANDAAIAHGAQALTPRQTAALKADQAATIKADFQQKSLFARYFSLTEPNSLASKALYENDNVREPMSNVASLFSAPLNLFSSFANILTPKTQAAEPFDYGFPTFGFALEKMEDERFQDPYHNADLIEPRLEELNSRYKKCFSTTVDPKTFVLTTGKSARYDEISSPANNCKNPGATFSDGTTELDRYSFYLADITAGKSMACYDGDEASCRELGFPGANSTPSQSANGNVYVLGDSLTVGMRDIGGLTQALQKQGWNPTIAAECGRHLASNGNNCAGKPVFGGLQQIDQPADNAAVKNAGAVIVGLGTNDPGSPAFGNNVKTMVDKIKALNPNAKIYWINLFSTDGKAPTYQAMNSTLNSLATTSGIKVIDWSKHAPTINAYPPGAYHPRDYKGMANFVVSQLGNAP